LGAAVAWVGDGAREGRGVQVAKLAGGFGHEQADFPVSGVEAKRDRRAVCRAKAAMGAEDKEFGVKQPLGLPPHTSILREAKKISGGSCEQHLSGDGQLALGTSRVRGGGGKLIGGRVENALQGERLRHGSSHPSR
jgi:hypothetical protein